MFTLGRSPACDLCKKGMGFMKKMIKRGLLAIATLSLAATTYSVAFPTTAFAKEESGSSYITVEKVWEDSDNKDGTRPDSVTVRVKIDAVETRSDEPIDYFSLISHNDEGNDDELSAEGPDGILGTDDDWTLVLSEENGWEVQIETITGGSSSPYMYIRGIEVEELDIPSGYTSSIEKDFSGDMLSGYIDVTNTKAAEEPVDPHDPDPVSPEEPVGPVQPETPTNPEEPVTPTEPGNTVPETPDTTPSAEAPAAGGDREKGSSEAPELPQTNDSSGYLLAAGLGSIVLLAGMGLAKKQS